MLLAHGPAPLVSFFTRYALATTTCAHFLFSWPTRFSSHISRVTCYTLPYIFLYQRFSNLPLELVGALHSNLEEDLGWSQQMHESDDGVVGGKVKDSASASDHNEFRSLQVIHK